MCFLRLGIIKKVLKMTINYTEICLNIKILNDRFFLVGCVLPTAIFLLLSNWVEQKANTPELSNVEHRLRHTTQTHLNHHFRKYMKLLLTIGRANS